MSLSSPTNGTNLTDAHLEELYTELFEGYAEYHQQQQQQQGVRRPSYSYSTVTTVSSPSFSSGSGSGRTSGLGDYEGRSPSSSVNGDYNAGVSPRIPRKPEILSNSGGSGGGYAHTHAYGYAGNAPSSPYSPYSQGAVTPTTPNSLNSNSGNGNDYPTSTPKSASPVLSTTSTSTSSHPTSRSRSRHSQTQSARSRPLPPTPGHGMGGSAATTPTSASLPLSASPNEFGYGSGYDAASPPYTTTTYGSTTIWGSGSGDGEETKKRSSMSMSTKGSSKSLSSSSRPSTNGTGTGTGHYTSGSSDLHSHAHTHSSGSFSSGSRSPGVERYSSVSGSSVGSNGVGVGGVVGRRPSVNTPRPPGAQEPRVPGFGLGHVVAVAVDPGGGGLGVGVGLGLGDGGDRESYATWGTEYSQYQSQSVGGSGTGSMVQPATPSVDGYVDASGSEYTVEVVSSGYNSYDGHGYNAVAGPSSPLTYESQSQSRDSTTSGSYLSPESGRYFNYTATNGDETVTAPTTIRTHTPTNLMRSPSDILQDIASYPATSSIGDATVPIAEDIEHDPWDVEDDEDDDPTRFINLSLLSHIAVQLRDKIPRSTHVKGSIPYPHAFTGKDIVSTIQGQIQRELAVNHGGVGVGERRRVAVGVARSLQSQLFFYEVEWGAGVLRDGVEDVYMFLDELDGPSGGGSGGGGGGAGQEELPTGVVTVLTRCYSPSCGEGAPCYSPRCPRKGEIGIVGGGEGEEGREERRRRRGSWSQTVPREVLMSLPQTEIHRQTIIHKLISKEEQYLADLDIVESVFLKPLREANPPVMAYPEMLDDFVDEVFSNILDLRETNRRLLEAMYVRQREQYPVIQRMGDILLEAATEFRYAYPIYVGNGPVAEKRLKEEMESNPELRIFLEDCERKAAKPGDSARPSLKHYLNRPSEHLQKYPVLLEAIHGATADENPDVGYLVAAIDAIRSLQNVAQLKTFQTSMGKGSPSKWEWHHLVSEDVRKGMSKEETKRQAGIFELISGEMAYVQDLENINNIYIRPLRTVDPPIIPHNRLDAFIADVFHNFAELHASHRKLVEKFHEIQTEEHPRIRSVTAAVLDAALNFRELYLEYIPNYPIAAYRIDEEMSTNLAFKQFVEDCTRHPDAHRHDMKNFVNRPIPRLLRYELLLKSIMDASPPNHPDRMDIPPVIDIIKSMAKDAEPGVVSSKQKVELWRYNANIVFKPGEFIDMDLLDENRSFIYGGKLLRQPESGLEWNGWSELYVLLFDNYLVLTKPRDRDGHVRYHVNKRPIPLDLLTLVNFSDPPTQRGAGLLRGLRGGGGGRGEATTPSDANSPDTAGDPRSVYPMAIHYNGRMGGNHILYAESAQIRLEWKQKLEEAKGLRQVVAESNKVFEIETLSTDTFLVPSLVAGATAPAWNQENSFTGKVTCSVPFNTPDGRALVAIGCAEGVWIGFRHDSRSMRRVLHLKMVTQCAMLEDFGIFLVLADKSLFAYHIEALVPSNPQSTHSAQTPQKLNGNRDVQFFSVGNLHGRTLVIYMKKKNLESVFHVVEPVVDKINERTKSPAGLGSRFGFRSPKSDWFRSYRDFFLPSEAYDLIFLKAKIAVLCSKGFEIMDLMDFKSVTIPQREDPRLAPLAKRCESCKPLGMFRSTDDEFLLCYDEFGIYVDKHGDPNRAAGTVEWEGTAVRVAFHSPYILLFDTRFIEIRHIQTGKLVQIIQGNEVRCLWDGRGTSLPTVVTTPTGEESMGQEPRVHAVMNSTDASVRLNRATAQHVFELIPTIPLYLPGSLASPSSATYFPQSMSPPHSPTLRPLTSYRA